MILELTFISLAYLRNQCAVVMMLMLPCFLAKTPTVPDTSSGMLVLVVSCKNSFIYNIRYSSYIMLSLSHKK